MARLACSISSGGLVFDFSDGVALSSLPWGVCGSRFRAFVVLFVDFVLFWRWRAIPSISSVWGDDSADLSALPCLWWTLCFLGNASFFRAQRSKQKISEGAPLWKCVFELLKRSNDNDSLLLERINVLLISAKSKIDIPGEQQKSPSASKAKGQTVSQKWSPGRTMAARHSRGSQSQAGQTCETQNHRPGRARRDRG